MVPRTSFVFARQRIVVAGEDSVAVAFAIATLRHDGHCVTHAEDVASALGDLSLGECQLLIAGSGLALAARSDLLHELRRRRPAVALLCLADASRAPGRETRSRSRVPMLHEPFTAEELRAAVRPLLPQLRIGSILALTADMAGPGACSGGDQAVTH